MHARLTTLQLRRDRLQDALDTVRDSVVPAAREQHGFESMLVASDPETGRALVISVWATEADMRAGESSGYYQEQISKIADALAGQPVREAYEVNVRE